MPAAVTVVLLLRGGLLGRFGRGLLRRFFLLRIRAVAAVTVVLLGRGAVSVLLRFVMTAAVVVPGFGAVTVRRGDGVARRAFVAGDLEHGPAHEQHRRVEERDQPDPADEVARLLAGAEQRLVDEDDDAPHPAGR